MTNDEIKKPHAILLVNKSGIMVKIEKTETDPLAYRISAGGRPKTGYYFVYRGDIEGVDRTLREVCEAWEIYKSNISK